MVVPKKPIIIVSIFFSIPSFPAKGKMMALLGPRSWDWGGSKQRKRLVQGEGFKVRGHVKTEHLRTQGCRLLTPKKVESKTQNSKPQIWSICSLRACERGITDLGLNRRYKQEGAVC